MTILTNIGIIIIGYFALYLVSLIVMAIVACALIKRTNFDWEEESD